MPTVTGPLTIFYSPTGHTWEFLGEATVRPGSPIHECSNPECSRQATHFSEHIETHAVAKPPKRVWGETIHRYFHCTYHAPINAKPL